TLWFRNTWAWSSSELKPVLNEVRGVIGARTIAATQDELGERFLFCETDVPLLFTENETNNQRFFNTPNPSRYVKDAINNYVVSGERNAINPAMTGTKASAEYQLTIRAGTMATVWLRLSDRTPASIG